VERNKQKSNTLLYLINYHKICSPMHTGFVIMKKKFGHSLSSTIFWNAEYIYPYFPHCTCFLIKNVHIFNWYVYKLCSKNLFSMRRSCVFQFNIWGTISKRICQEHTLVFSTTLRLPVVLMTTRDWTPPPSGPQSLSLSRRVPRPRSTHVPPALSNANSLQFICMNHNTH
jgi:hypothetical protein